MGLDHLRNYCIIADMWFVIVSLILSFGVLAWSDKLLKNHRLSQEFARKSSHILSGTLVAFWPWFISWNWIAILAAIYLLGVILSRKTSLFKDVRFVNRLSWGEYFYPTGVIAICLIQPTNIVFAVAMLHFSLGDAFAAIIGREYGKNPYQYKVFGQTKSIIGSLVFVAISLCLVGSLLLFSTYSLSPWLILVVPLVATILENIGEYGSDNLLVPLGVVIMLNI